MSPDASVTVRDNPEEERFEAFVDGELAGFAVYRTRPGMIAFVHTEIDERFEGQGVGSALVRAALDDVRVKELSLLPFCPFVNGYVDKHREYADLVPEDHREAFGL